MYDLTSITALCDYLSHLSSSSHRPSIRSPAPPSRASPPCELAVPPQLALRIIDIVFSPSSISRAPSSSSFARPNSPAPPYLAYSHPSSSSSLDPADSRVEAAPFSTLSTDLHTDGCQPRLSFAAWRPGNQMDVSKTKTKTSATMSCMSRTEEMVGTSMTPSGRDVFTTQRSPENTIFSSRRILLRGSTCPRPNFDHHRALGVASSTD